MAERATAQQLVDTRHDRIALVAGQRAAGHEVRLHVDDDQCGMGVDGVGHERGPVAGTQEACRNGDPMDASPAAP